MERLDMLKELGANHLGGDDFGFLVWSPFRESVSVKVVSGPERNVSMHKRQDGYFEAVLEGLGPGRRYLFELDGGLERPDPASRSQPDGVHLTSETVRHDSFGWTDQAYEPPHLEDYIIYELHVGTFTPEGTFEAAARCLPYLVELGVTAVELMPVGQFPGSRNWGYDGAFPYAVQNSYGGPSGLKHLVNECHMKGMAVILDVVYNHLGPEGNYLGDFGPYFTDRYRAPWGSAVNFDGPFSEGPRRFFIENALYWLEHFHIDALRIDAVHGIFDFGAKHFLKELNERVRARVGDRRVYIIPESDLNDVRIINPVEEGGYGLDAQWNDDFHHCLHTLLTGEDNGYYMDFGGMGPMAKALDEGFVYTGQYSRFRERRHGNSSRGRPPGQFVVFGQNHDQVGNRVEGDRLAANLPTEKLALAACMVIMSPYIPLLFMGEEYGESAPFHYFTSHSDNALAERIRKGREEEFSAFGCTGMTDPQEESTFLRSKIDIEKRHAGAHRELFDLYKALIRLRKEFAPLRDLGREDVEVTAFKDEMSIVVKLPGMIYAANFSDFPVQISAGQGVRARKVFDSSGPGSHEASLDVMTGLVSLPPYGFSLFRVEV
jgi:maltooligosyltrehalose trehalohydrolase